MNENERRLSVILIVFYCINVYHSFDSRHFSIDNLPLWPKEIPLIEMHSGHLPVDVEENELLFFWHFASKYSIDQNRTAIGFLLLLQLLQEHVMVGLDSY